ncbi:hypothetical protein C4D60_Mb01t17610 [Musa balbisiana]|uniref:Uncharacterized protein n=1 Tax=Musa balbisiana TaxID=52838 RepID=A0A4S8JMZ9_MUSBA|nr:hypothetical protein C4D60_Mb01t17610 [Musa balbisiana]
MRGKAQVVSNRSESMAMEDHNGVYDIRVKYENEKMETVGSETEAYALLTRSLQRIFDANTDCCRLPMEQPTRSSTDSRYERDEMLAQSKAMRRAAGTGPQATPYGFR